MADVRLSHPTRRSILALTLAAGLGPVVGCGPSEVTINGRKADPAELGRLEQTYGVTVAPGDYWYDGVSGLAGYDGQPPQAYAPGFSFGQVPRDASDGATGLVFNGRELPEAEARFYAGLFGVTDLAGLQGDYTLAYTGDLFVTATGQYLGNLATMAHAAGFGGGGGGDGFWSTGSGAAGNSSGGCSYISLPGGSSVTSGCG